jgi:hypothetical protein
MCLYIHAYIPIFVRAYMHKYMHTRASTRIASWSLVFRTHLCELEQADGTLGHYWCRWVSEFHGNVLAHRHRFVVWSAEIVAAGSQFAGFYLSIYLPIFHFHLIYVLGSIYLSICLSVSLPLCLSMSLSPLSSVLFPPFPSLSGVWVSGPLSSSIFLSLSVYVCLIVLFVCFCLSVYPSACLSLSVSVRLCLSCLSVLSLCPSISLSLNLSLSLSLSLSQSLSVCLISVLIRARCIIHWPLHCFPWWWWW